MKYLKYQPYTHNIIRSCAEEFVFSFNCLKNENTQQEKIQHLRTIDLMWSSSCLSLLISPVNTVGKLGSGNNH